MQTKTMLCKYSVSVLVREVMQNRRKAISRSLCSLKKRCGCSRAVPLRGCLAVQNMDGWLWGGTWERPPPGAEDANKRHTRVKRGERRTRLFSSSSSSFAQFLSIYCES